MGNVSLNMDSANAETLGGIAASELDRVRAAVTAGPKSINTDGTVGVPWTALDSVYENKVVRAQVNAQERFFKIFSSEDGGASYNEIPSNWSVFANHSLIHHLPAGSDILEMASADYSSPNPVPDSGCTWVRIMNSPTCPTNYGYDPNANDFIYCIIKIIGSMTTWITVKAFDIRGNVEFINSKVGPVESAAWSGWTRTADGGDAAAVGGLRTSDLMKNIAPWSSGDIKDLLLASESGCVFIASGVTGMPVNDTYWFGIVNASTTHRNLTVYQIDGRYAGYISYNSGNQMWHEWTPLNNSIGNPNLLDNPDFKINQRGKNEYRGLGYGIDRWTNIFGGEIVNVVDDGITITVLNNQGIRQFISTPERLSGKTVTLSACFNVVGDTDATGANVVLNNDLNIIGMVLISGSHNDYEVKSTTFQIPSDVEISKLNVSISGEGTIGVKWVKLELSNAATPFVAPNPAEELLKIQSMNDDGTPKLVSNDLLPTVVNSQMISNPNLLRNPDFRINQRGESVYNITSDSYVYTVDGWQTHKVDNYTARLTVDNNGIILGPCTPLIEIIESSDGISGREVTLSACVNGTVVFQTFVWIVGRDYTIVYDRGKFRMAYIDNGVIRYVQILNYSATESKQISWVKLEIGSVATPFTPPDPATELAKCQRYFYRLGGLKKNFVLQGLAYSPTSMSFTYQFPVEMRTVPTLSVSKGNWRFCIQKIPYEGARYWNNEYGFVFSVNANLSYSQRVSINVNFDDTKSTIITAGDPVTIETNIDSDSNGNQKYPGWIDFDAEL